MLRPINRINPVVGLRVTLRGMREAGYGYAVIGAPGPVGFYQRRLDALEIPRSEPGIYAGMLRST